jgi:prepilin-type N-terminal cleavage/methylation domain-containing protein
MNHQKGKQPGFTLVELILTIVAIGILAAIAVTNYIPLQKSAKRAACLSNQRSIEEAQKLYFSRTAIETGKGVYPQTLDELAPYMLDGILPSCPDGYAYELLPDGGAGCPSPDHQR